MNKYRSFKLVLVFIMSFFILINNIVPAHAESRDIFSRDNLITLAKGIASIYLLSKVDSLVKGTKETVPSVESQNRSDSVKKSQINGKIILLDPGHGGHDPGAVGSNGLKEKDVALDIALRTYQLLKKNTNAKVYLTRDADRFVSLNERSAMANNLGADVFISIHINGAENGIERGIETYAHYNSSKKAWALAWYIQDNLVKKLGLIDRGLKADNFHVVRETNMESVLLEIGFITDPAEEEILGQNSTRERAANAIYNGILRYYNNS